MLGKPIFPPASGNGSMLWASKLHWGVLCNPCENNGTPPQLSNGIGDGEKNGANEY